MRSMAGSKGELIKNLYISFREGCLVLSRLVGSKDQPKDLI